MTGHLARQLSAIARITVGAVATVHERRAHYARALVGPAVVFVALALSRGPAQSSPLAGALFALAHVLVYTVIAVTSHRITLLGPNAVSRWGNLRFGPRELRFLSNFLMLLAVLVGLVFAAGLVLVLPLVALTGVQESQAASERIVTVASSLLSLVAMYFLARLSLVFPAASLDEDLSFSDSWRLTADHQGLMLFVTLVLPVIANLPAMALAGTQSLVVHLGLQLFSLVAVVVIVTALSLAYLELRDRPPRPPTAGA